MKLFLVSQSVNNGYDTYDSFVAVAENEEQARHTHPDGGTLTEFPDGHPRTWRYDWVENPDDVAVLYLGEYSPNPDDNDSPIICASFNAG